MAECQDQPQPIRDARARRSGPAVRTNETRPKGAPLVRSTARDRHGIGGARPKEASGVYGAVRAARKGAPAAQQLVIPELAQHRPQPDRLRDARWRRYTLFCVHNEFVGWTVLRVVLNPRWDHFARPRPIPQLFSLPPIPPFRPPFQLSPAVQVRGCCAPYPATPLSVQKCGKAIAAPPIFFPYTPNSGFLQLPQPIANSNSENCSVRGISDKMREVISLNGRS